MIGVTFLVRTLDRLIAIKTFEICGHIVMKLGGAPHGHDKRRCLTEVLALRELSTSNDEQKALKSHLRARRTSEETPS